MPQISRSARNLPGPLSKRAVVICAGSFCTAAAVLLARGGWVAGRSAGGSDHIHVVVNRVREDGKPAKRHMDRRRAQQACRRLEQEFGLRQVEGRGRAAGERGIKPVEMAARGVDGRRNPFEWIPDGHTPRRRLERIVRACATAAADEPDFVARLNHEGVLRRPRFEQAVGRTSSVIRSRCGRWRARSQSGMGAGGSAVS